MDRKNETSWAAKEFDKVNLGDKRLDSRLINLCERFSDAPESPINQACLDWAETKAAYRFFQNCKGEANQILSAHCRKTVERANQYNTVLALQDTSYFIYTGHLKTEGLGKMQWRIEMFFKVMKSGFRVEACRLAHADRLARYLTIISIVAWRLFMITLIARTNPTSSCSLFLDDLEWQVLFLKVNKKQILPKKPPDIGEVVIWIARLGGYLARKKDGPPGTITLWRGWKRLMDLTDGLYLANLL